LQEDVYPRIDLAPGLSYATSSLLNYIILALGFVAGLGVLGVDFSKVSVLAGAFVSASASGYKASSTILSPVLSCFSSGRPRRRHRGSRQLQGTVRRIGIRASVIHTRAGADIIMPNSQLITDKVTNWTLSDKLRRIDLPVGLNYGANPKKVTEALGRRRGCASAGSERGRRRSPFYELWRQLDQFRVESLDGPIHSPTRIKSDLASRVYDAVSAAAGMSFPFPSVRCDCCMTPRTTVKSATKNKDIV
jgi:hypothetical protein